MKLKLKQYEFLRFVQEQDDWNSYKFAEILSEYWLKRNEEKYQPDWYIWSREAMTEAEFIDLK